MKQYNFDEIIERKNTNSLKFDCAALRGLPEISLVEPEGTCFAWLDAGHIFGEKSEQFQRVVLACPRSTLTRALEQLEAAVRA